MNINERKSYKVWISVEERTGEGRDERNHEYMLPDPIGEFDTPEMAQSIVEQVLHTHNPGAMESSDHVNALNEWRERRVLI